MWTCVQVGPSCAGTNWLVQQECTPCNSVLTWSSGVRFGLVNVVMNTISGVLDLDWVSSGC